MSEDDAGAGSTNVGMGKVREKVFLEVIGMKFVTSRREPQPHQSGTRERSVRGRDALFKRGDNEDDAERQ